MILSSFDTRAASFPFLNSLNRMCVISCICWQHHINARWCLKTSKKEFFYFEEFDAHLGKSFSFFPFLYCTNIAITCTAFRQRKFMNGKLFHAFIFIFNYSQFSGVFIITHNIQKEIETEMSGNSFFEAVI